MADIKYIKGVFVKEGKYGLSLTGKAEDVINQIREHTGSDGKFRWNINKRKEVGKYGDTHSVSVNEWSPTGQQTEQKQSSGHHPDSNSFSDDLPF